MNESDSIFSLDKYGDIIAMIDESGNSVSYKQLLQLSNELGSYINPNQLLLCLCSNTIPSIVGYVACIQNKVPALLVGSNQSIDEYLNGYCPNFIWAPIECQYGKIIYKYDGYGLFSYSDCSSEINSNLALLLTTSGSTGSPKLVRLSRLNLKANALSIANYLDITPKERAITSLPMNYSFGMSVINSHFIMGGCLLVTNRSVLDFEFWNFFKKQEGTSIAGVPYTYEMLKRFRFFKMNLPSLKTMIQAGGRLDPTIVSEYAHFAQKEGKRFFVMYGQTEAAPRISYLPFDKAIEKPSSIGIAIPGGKILLLDKNENIIQEPDREGELVYLGDNVCMGYALNRNDLIREDDNKGVLHTGDLAKKDKDGFFYITGRMKRFVKIWGNRVDLDSLERFLKQASYECACVGVDNRVVVFVTKEGMAEDIIQQLSQKTGLNKSAFEVKYIVDIPKAGSGKIQYSELLKMI